MVKNHTAMFNKKKIRTKLCANKAPYKPDLPLTNVEIIKAPIPITVVGMSAPNNIALFDS